MKNLIDKIALLFLLSTVCCWAAEKKAKPADVPQDTHSLVASVTPGANGAGTITINGDAPFAVTANTTIVVDNKPAKLTDVKVGMKVISRTAPDSSMPEIDLKTVPSTDTPKKSKKAAA
jgi:hypothetical protein